MRRFAREHELTANQEGKVEPQYLAEVERMTARRESLYARREAAKIALARAEEGVHEAKKAKSRSAIRAAWRLVERRHAELAALERLMTSSPGASSAHRGTSSLWPTHAAGAVARIPDNDATRVRDGRRHPVKTREQHH